MMPKKLADSLLEEAIAQLDAEILVVHMSAEQKMKLVLDLSLISAKLNKVAHGEPYPVTIPIPA